MLPPTTPATADAGGTIEPSGDVVVNYGADQVFTITPDTGYDIADVLVDGVSVGAVASYTFENVTADHTIHATFAADVTPPTVVSTSPAVDATGVPVTTVVTATFSEAMDASTITISSFTLDGVSGTVSYDSATRTATFTPSADLAENTTYTATLSTAITDVAGNPLAAAGM